MPMVHWILPDGARVSADVADGTNLMEASLARNIAHVIGECGGCLSCATCHVYVDDAWLPACGPVEEVENAMLDIVTAPRQANSRLCCQILAGPATDGIVLHVPDPSA